MAKLTYSNSKTVICDAEPIFSSGCELFSISLSGQQSPIAYHMHLTAEVARQFAAYVLAHDKVLPEVEVRPS
jgi:hypothetical protein